MRFVPVARFDDLAPREPVHALVEGVDLVLIRLDGQEVSALYGRCLHRGALLSDGHVVGDDLICGLHDWDYRVDSGVWAYNNEEALPKFPCRVEAGEVIGKKDVALPPPLPRGTRVQVVSQSGGVQVHMTGTLVQSVRLGGRGRVRVPMSRRALSGRLMEPERFVLEVKR